MSIKLSAMLLAAMILACQPDDSHKSDDAAPGPGIKAVKIVSSANDTCAVLDTGIVSCWGQISRSTLTKRVDFPIENSRASDLALSKLWNATPGTILLEDGTVKMWDDVTSSFSKSIQLGDQKAVAVSGSVFFDKKCAILDDGLVKCWQDWMDIPTLVELGSGQTAKALSASKNYACVLLDDGTVKCWGNNSLGSLGDGTRDDRSVPTPTAPLGGKALALSSSDTHTCALLEDGTIKCWGAEVYFVDRKNYKIPSAIAPLGEGRRAVAIATGDEHICAIIDDGTVDCCGANQHGQLGDGTRTSRETPTTTLMLGEGRKAIAISAGNNHTCIILDDQSVKCWGDNFFGQTGGSSFIR